MPVTRLDQLQIAKEAGLRVRSSMTLPAIKKLLSENRLKVEDLAVKRGLDKRRASKSTLDELLTFIRDTEEATAAIDIATELASSHKIALREAERAGRAGRPGRSKRSRSPSPESRGSIRESKQGSPSPLFVPSQLPSFSRSLSQAQAQTQAETKTQSQTQAQVSQVASRKTQERGKSSKAKKTASMNALKSAVNEAVDVLGFEVVLSEVDRILLPHRCAALSRTTIR